MSIWSDDFNRADGGLGNNWVLYAGNIGIANQRASYTASGYAYQPDVNASGRHDVIYTLEVAALGNVTAGVAIKVDPSDYSCYCANGAGAIATPTWYIKRRSGGAWVTLAQVNGGAIAAGTHTLRFLYDEGTLTLWVDGSIMVRTYDSTHGAHTCMGLVSWGVSNILDSLTFYGDEATALTVTPNPIGNYGSTTEVTFTGVGTNWTPGTPGTPVFTVDHGTLTNQTIASATSATATYNPGTFLGTATFVDPSTGGTCQVTVTSNTEIVPPEGGGDTWAPYKTLVDATGTLFTPDWLLTDRSPIIPSSEEVPGALDIINAIQQIWLAHFGTWTGTPPATSFPFYDLVALIAGSYTPTVQLYEQARTTSIREEVEAIRDRFYDPNSQTYWTLSEVIASVKGLDNRSITQVYDLVDALTGGSNEDVLTWLDTYLGTTGPTLEQLGTMISDLATIAGYDLGNVLDAIAAIPGTDLTAITNKLNLIQPSEAADLTTITNQLTTIDGNVDDLENSLAAIRTGSNYTFQDILDAIAAITPGGPGESGPALSLWPGQENVTLGTELPLSDGMTVPGPLNGLIFTITASAPRAQKFMFGTVASWARVGQVLFRTDRGDYERGQTYGIDRHIVIPTTMTEAASALILVNSNWEGTVTPWTRT